MEIQENEIKRKTRVYISLAPLLSGTLHNIYMIEVRTPDTAFIHFKKINF